MGTKTKSRGGRPAVPDDQRRADHAMSLYFTAAELELIRRAAEAARPPARASTWSRAILIASARSVLAGPADRRVDPC